MGNSNATLVEGRYEVLKDREGYGVILGNEMGTQTEDTIGQRLASAEKALSSCRVHAMAPFLNRGGSEKPNAAFSKEDFKRVCLMHFDKDMLRNLSSYSSHFFYYCGLCNENGVLTKEGDSIPYSEIINSILSQSEASGKPVIFIFDCNFTSELTFDLTDLMASIKNDLSPFHDNVLICFVSQSCISNVPPGIFTRELGESIQMFSNHLPLTDILTVAGLKAKLRVASISERLIQGPAVLSTLSAQFFLVPSPLPVTGMVDYLSYVDCCHLLLKEQGALPLPVCKPTPTPGNGRRVFIVCSTHGRSHARNLSSWLQSLGLEVYSDRFEEEEEGGSEDWLRWYLAHLVKCENVLVECSPETVNNFQSLSPSTSRRSAYSRLISSIYQRLDTDEVHLRFFPVIFSSQFGMESVPGVFSGDKVYRLTNGLFPKQFDPQRITSQYDELVFDICNLPHPKPPPVQPPVQQFSAQPSFAQPPLMKNPIVITPEMIAPLYQLRPGYIPVSYVTPPKPSYRPSPPIFPFPPPPQPTPPLVNPAPPPPTKGIKLPQGPVSQSAFLWLSQRVTQWKFMARHLRVPEYEITRIIRENPRDISEQVIQMLYSWKNQSIPSEVTYRKLLDAVEFAERDQKLFDNFVQFICEQKVVD